MSRKIYLWRSTPVEVRDSVSNDHSQIPSSCILASARQGITKALYLSGLNRENFVAIPDYTSHCVIDFIGRLATPVPSRFIPPESMSPRPAAMWPVFLATARVRGYLVVPNRKTSKY